MIRIRIANFSYVGSHLTYQFFVDVQIIDDVKGATLVSCSTLDKDMIAKVKGMTKSEAAAEVGKAVAQKALQAGITQVVFDRGGYLYTGRAIRAANLIVLPPLTTLVTRLTQMSLLSNSSS